MTATELLTRYAALKRPAARDLRNPALSTAFRAMAIGALDLLVALDQTQLNSSVTGKSYVAYEAGGRISRPINAALFIDQPAELASAIEHFSADGLLALPPTAATRLLYTMAMAFCAAMDVSKDRDRQTPATFFAILVAHVFAITLDMHPQTAIDVLAFEEQRTSLPTDYVFLLGPGRNKIHLPIKTSGRAAQKVDQTPLGK